MIDFGGTSPSICVLGRTAFGTDLGAVAYGTAETLARNFPVAFRPIEPERQGCSEIELPNGRRLPVQAAASPTVSIFCDVLWDGADDHAWSLLPGEGMVYAWLLFDSDRLPTQIVERLNRRADVVLVPSPHLRDVARGCLVEPPITILPIPLDLDGLLAQPARSPGPCLSFGSIAAFHPRQGQETLITAFRSRFEGDASVRLVLHGDLAFGGTLDRLRGLAQGAGNISIRCDDLARAGRDALLDGIDVFVSCSRGEGYGIGPREALAAGKPVIAAAVGGHQELGAPPGLFLVPPAVDIPARYPEIFGSQRAVLAPAVADALEAARGFVASGEAAATATARRLTATRWSFTALAASVGALIDPSIARYRPAPWRLAPQAEAVIERRLGHRGDAIGGIRRQVCPAYDAGFFSIFNAFMSHLVWQERDDRCHAVLPDWDVDRLIQRMDAGDIIGNARSFCYGQPGDGNLWLKLFQPLFGLTEAEMQDEGLLWRHAEAPLDRHNEAREPKLTYVRAYELYRSAEFAAVRRQYHRVFARHVRLRPELQSEIDAFTAAHLEVPIRIAAHVRHPSHTIEQPEGRIAHTEAYIARVRDEVRRRGADPDAAGWAVFVATDQARVLDRFRAAFGARAVFYPEARRTRADEDAAFDALDAAEQNRDGHQLQHLVAADRAGWSWRLAWEVVRDAFTMARCQALLHVVSNVSTAVAYVNPELEMIFCEA